MTTRPYFNKSSKELAALFEQNQIDSAVVKKVHEELTHRKTPTAVSLRNEVERFLKREDSAPKGQNSTYKLLPAQEKEHLISCKLCDTPMRIPRNEKRVSYRCPSCNALFDVAFVGEFIEVTFVKEDVSDKQRGEVSSDKVAVDNAYEILDMTKEGQEDIGNNRYFNGISSDEASGYGYELSNDFMSFEQDEDPEDFYKRTSTNTDSGTFRPITKTASLDAENVEVQWNADLATAHISGDGIGDSINRVLKDSSENGFLKVGNRGPRSSRSAVLPVGTSFSIDVHVVECWAFGVIDKGWVSADDIDELLISCRGNADLGSLKNNILRNLEVVSVDKHDYSEEIIIIPSDMALEDLVESLNAICSRDTLIPGMGRFDMAKRLDSARFLPIATAKQELLLRVLACDPVIDEVLKRIDLRLVGLLDYSEIEGAVTDLHEWRREGKASEGRRWRQAVSALNAIDLPSKFIKDIVEELWMPFSDNPISLSNLYEQIAELEASVKRVTSEYLPLVRRFASRNTGEDEELEDVFQVSYIGLHRAAHRFDPEIGERFSTYAIYGMQQSLNRWRGDEGRTIRLPIHRHDSVILFDQAFSKLEATYCRAPTVSELAIALGWDQKEVQKIMSIARLGIHPESLEEWDDLYDYSDTESTTELTRERTELSQVISSILSELDDREADVIRRRYGINLDEEMTLQEIGDIYGLTRERIRQVEAKAMKKLSHPARVRRITKSLGIY